MLIKHVVCVFSACCQMLLSSLVENDEAMHQLALLMDTPGFWCHLANNIGKLGHSDIENIKLVVCQTIGEIC